MTAASNGKRGQYTAAGAILQAAGTRRYRDASFDAIAVKLLPGEHYVTQSSDEMIVTVLGSCVSACIRDPRVGAGGMNHFMLPASSSGEWGQVPASLRYGNFAMERLINDIIKLGGRRSNLEIKVFGGANVLRNGGTIGHQNSEFIESYLKAERLPIAARHLYGGNPRRIHYFPSTGKVSMLELQWQENIDRMLGEEKYQQTLKHAVTGCVEYF